MTQYPGEAELRETVTQFLDQDVSTLGLHEPLGDALGIDSLTGLELMAFLEDRFDIYFNDEHLAQRHTLGTILAAWDDVSWRRAS